MEHSGPFLNLYTKVKGKLNSSRNPLWESCEKQLSPRTLISVLVSNYWSTRVISELPLNIFGIVFLLLAISQEPKVPHTIYFFCLSTRSRILHLTFINNHHNKAYLSHTVILKTSPDCWVFIYGTSLAAHL